MPQAESVAAVAAAKVLLVDDHALLRTGVANIINQEPDLHVVAEATNGAEGVEAFTPPARHHLARPADAGHGRRGGRAADARSIRRPR